MRKCACADVLRFGLLVLRNHVMRNQNMLLKAVAGMARAPEVVVESVKRFSGDRTYFYYSLTSFFTLLYHSLLTHIIL